MGAPWFSSPGSEPPPPPTPMPCCAPQPSPIAMKLSIKTITGARAGAPTGARAGEGRGVLQWQRQVGTRRGAVGSPLAPFIGQSRGGGVQTGWSPSRGDGGRWVAIRRQVPGSMFHGLPCLMAPWGSPFPATNPLPPSQPPPRLATNGNGQHAAAGSGGDARGGTGQRQGGCALPPDASVGGGEDPS